MVTEQARHRMSEARKGKTHSAGKAFDAVSVHNHAFLMIVLGACRADTGCLNESLLSTHVRVISASLPGILGNHTPNPNQKFDLQLQRHTLLT